MALTKTLFTQIQRSAVALLCLYFAMQAAVVSAASSTTSPQALLKSMSLKEKIGQLQQMHCPALKVEEISDELKQAIREGRVGSVLNALSPEIAQELQRLAVEEGPKGVPLIIARDVIHGFRTVMPIPLGQAASWNEDMVERGAEIAAIEASSVGIRWTFAPMLDISRDPRWGRITESFGEDPYLTAVLGAASVRGYQGDDLSDPTRIAATAKHFLGYGAAEGGRDYNSTYIPEPLLHNVYLKPFTAAVDAGAASIMSAFNELNGVPASANPYILDTILRKELGFKGVVVSDWDSVLETVKHGFAADEKEAAKLAANAGVDIEMVSTTYQNNLAALVKEGKVSEKTIDKLVLRVLEMKQNLGLFKAPYHKPNPDAILAADHLADAEKIAQQSIVLLKNKDKVLPLSSKQKIALIGPLADAGHDQLGSWAPDGQKQDSVTVLQAFRDAIASDKQLSYHQALYSSRSTDQKDFKKVLRLAKKSDVIVLVGGEEAVLSGEAHSRADLRLPGAQQKLIKALAKTGKPIVLVIMAGRQIALADVIDDVDAVMMAWHPGTMGGPAIVSTLYGNAEPSGRLPVTWPKYSGQVPLYYNHSNTGRPPREDIYIHMNDYPLEAEQHSTGHESYYIDAGFQPQFPFGFGLSYSQVEYSNIQLSKNKIKVGEPLKVSAQIKNVGERPVDEVVQLYIRDLSASSVRPVRELKDYQRVSLKPGEAKQVSFTLEKDDLSFFNQKLEQVVEPGAFHVWVAPNAEAGLQESFSVEM